MVALFLVMILLQKLTEFKMFVEEYKFWTNRSVVDLFCYITKLRSFLK